MRPSCPRCFRSEFPYRALLSVHPAAGESSPYCITCPSCGTELRVTAKSRLFAAVAIVGSFIGCMFLLGLSPVQLSKWQAVAVAMAILAAYYFAVWPLVVRFKPWSPFRYWLPKSRLIGYTVYLLIPVAMMALILYLAIKFGP